jgi:hypothetical protein
MRTLWKTLSFLAVVNLLALIVVIAWLWQSGRLTRERAIDIRAMLSTTAAQASDEAGRLATEAEIQRLRDLEDMLRENPPADSATQSRQIALVHQQREESLRRLDDERRMLAGQLQEATTRMEASAGALQQQKDAMKGDLEADAQRKIDEQFLRAVKQLEQVPPKQAKKMIETLVAENKVDQAVAYLDSMASRSAAKILREFKEGAEIALATDLLERLRTRGLAAEGSAPSSTSARPDASKTSVASDGQESPYAAAGAASRTQSPFDSGAQ